MRGARIGLVVLALSLGGFYGRATDQASATASPAPNSVTAHGGAPTFAAGGMDLAQPLVGIAPTPSGAGYWLVAADGGVFSFGDAVFRGSVGGMRLNQPVVGMAATPSGAGYWLVAADGGVFSFGDAVFRGSPGGAGLGAPVVGLAPTPAGAGYWLAAADGAVANFGDANSFGSDAGGAPTVAIAGRADGYWLVHGVATTPLAPGATGAAVMRLQERLQGLGYWLGGAPGVDGHYGLLTVQAVYAFQKITGLPPDGVVGEATAAALDRAVRPFGTDGGNLIEVDKHRQVLLVVRGGQVLWAFNTSTGTGQPYFSDGSRSVAITPDGRYSIYRQVDGYDVSPLGVLYRPKYVVAGIAIHGYPSVPPRPASHGCIRVTDQAMDFLWASGLAPVGAAVWVHD